MVEQDEAPVKDEVLGDEGEQEAREVASAVLGEPQEDAAADSAGDGSSEETRRADDPGTDPQPEEQVAETETSEGAPAAIEEADEDAEAAETGEGEAAEDGEGEAAEAEEAAADAGGAEEGAADKPVEEPEVVEAGSATGRAAKAEAEDDDMRWYVIHTYSGYEKKVKQSLEERVRTAGLGDDVAELLIPTEDIVEMKGGKKVVTAKKFFPGYLLVRMRMSDQLWHVVKNTPRVTGFVGSGRQPIPLPQHEVDKIVNRMEESVEAPKPKFQFRKGESVRIIDGPFTNFTGKVDEVDNRRNTLKVMVSIFGRNTPVELDFFQVEKV